MDDNTPEVEQSQGPQVEIPDLNNIEPWLEKYITKPFKGFRDKKHPDGTPLSERELIEATRDQLRIQISERPAFLAYNNKLAIKKGLPPISPEQYDETIKKNLITIAGELLPISEHK